jgi:hypothetical protein
MTLGRRGRLRELFVGDVASLMVDVSGVMEVWFECGD